jgi:hypothetical protein
MPLYNNSFYFYFGIKKGSTAIDKFNEMFYAPCNDEDKKPFLIDIDKRSRSYCPEAYDETQKGRAYIRVVIDEIRKPYNYKLYDSNHNVIVEEEGLVLDFLVFGGSAETKNSDVVCADYYVKKQKSGEYVVNSRGEKVEIRNQVYFIEIEDENGNKMKEKIELTKPKIFGEYNVKSLGTKFYNSATTRIDYICHEDNKFYGEIDLTNFTVDGYFAIIDDARYIGYDDDGKVLQVCITGSSVMSSQKLTAMVELSILGSSDEDSELKDCLCDK